MIYAAAFLAVLFFVFALGLLRVVHVGAEVIETSRAAAEVVRDPVLSDEEKELRMRRASVTLVRSFLSISLRTLAAVAAASLPLFVFELAAE